MSMILTVTGGIGSGKSTVLEVLKEHGFTVFPADSISREIMTPGHRCFELLIDAFGTGILGADGQLDKKAFAELIYHDPAALKRCDEIVHPRTVEEISARIEVLRKKDPDAKICIEAAIPVEGVLRLADEIWYVYADRDTRIRRLRETRGYTEEYAKNIMDQQLGDEVFFLLADRIIDNGGSLEETRLRVEELLENCSKDEMKEKSGRS